MMRLHRIIGRAVAIVSVAAVGIAISLARGSEWPIAALVILAMAWGAAPQAIDAFLGNWNRPQPPPHVGDDAAAGTFTIAVHVGGQPTEISRVSVAAAAAAAPTVVVATSRAAADLLGPMPCPVVVGETVEDALNRAVATIDTDALLVLSAGSFAEVRAARVAAGLIRRGAGWVIGRARTFNRDGFSPLVRGRLGGRLRSSARAAGLQLWEPNATLVSTRLVRRHPFVPGRPWGASLRSMSTSGVTGLEHDLTLAMTSEPVDARSYWPTSVLRRRRAVADTADAAVTTRGRSRWLAVGLLLRELDGCLLTLWLVFPWLVTRGEQAPFRCPLWVLAILTGAPAALRWIATRFGHRARAHPLEDMLALAFDAPGSVLAIPTAFTRRLAPTRLPVPGQPLVIAALLFAAITAVPLFTEGTTAHRSQAVGLALTELALLWLLAMRVIFQRNWARTIYRVRASLAADVDGHRVTTRDLSPAGLSFAGALGEMPVGSDVAIELTLDDGSVLSARGTVEDRRAGLDEQIAGVSLRVPPADRSRWVAQLSRAVAAAPSEQWRVQQAVRTAQAPREATASRWLRRALGAAIVTISLSAAVALCLALVGYRPLIVRSGSMEPAVHVGDVVLVEDVRVRQLEVGDIATVPDPDEVSDTLTHRVRAITNIDGDVILTTRGDANENDETFSLPAETIVGRVVTRIPAIGAAVAWAGDTWVRGFAAVIGAAAIGAVVLRNRHHHTRRCSPVRP